MRQRLDERPEVLEMLVDAADWSPPEHSDLRSVEEIIADVNRQVEQRLKEVVAILHGHQVTRP